MRDAGGTLPWPGPAGRAPGSEASICATRGAGICHDLPLMATNSQRRGLGTWEERALVTHAKEKFSCPADTESVVELRVTTYCPESGRLEMVDWGQEVCEQPVTQRGPQAA